MNGLEGLGGLVPLASFLVAFGAIAAAIVVAYGFKARKMATVLPIAAVLWVAPWLIAIPEHNGLRDLIDAALHPQKWPMMGPAWISPTIGLVLVLVIGRYTVRAMREATADRR